MTNKASAVSLDKIIKKAIEAIDSSKNEIYDIAQSARRECRKLEDELEQIKSKVRELIDDVEKLELELSDSKKKLVFVNKNYDKFTQEELKDAYEKADNIRIDLIVKREQEQFFLSRRNDMEVRIREAYKTVQKADGLIENVGVALSVLTGDLQEMSMKIEDIQQKQWVGIRIIKAQEEERQRMAREMHDGPAQLMSNIVLKAEICEKLADIDIGKTKIELTQLKEFARENLQEIRKIIYNLRPMSLDDLGLVPTLERYVSNFQDETGVVVSLKTRNINNDLKPVISLTLFRIVQEAISNVRKHANAKNLSINLETVENVIKLYVIDNGKGFDMSDPKVKSENINSGFGLFSMKERVALLDGNLEIQSAPGKGTSLKVSIPLAQNKEELDE